MKRHKALQRLSSEHHNGLVWALQLKKASRQEDQSGQSAIVQGFLQFWESELQEHFVKEELYLFPVYYRCVREIIPAVTQTLHQHVIIRSAVLGLQEEAKSGTVSSKRLLEISDLLNQHVRFEERTLFEEIQRNCLSATLDTLLHVPGLSRIVYREFDESAGTKEGGENTRD